MSGWVAMKRGLNDHPIFQGQPLRIAVWYWMVSTAAWQRTSQDLGGKRITIERGQLLTSYRQMSAATGVGVQVIRTLLDQLTNQHAINTATNTGRLLITICNYDKYQAGGTDANTPAKRDLTSDQHTKEQVNKKQTPPSEEATASLGPDGSEQIVEYDAVNRAVWQAGKGFLAAKGVANPGAMIGRWLKANKPLAVLAAIDAAQKSGTEEPIPYITAALNGGQYEQINRNHGQPAYRPAHRADPALEQIARLAGLH